MKYCCEEFPKHIYRIYRFSEEHPEKGWQFFLESGWGTDFTDEAKLIYCPFCGEKLNV